MTERESEARDATDGMEREGGGRRSGCERVASERPSERDSELPLRPTVIKRGRDQILHGGGGGVGGPEFMCFGPKASCAFIF